jgi:NAD(P)-dependent dehydrogenase (short-subunit alcohol dehydrogenase family)
MKEKELGKETLLVVGAAGNVGRGIVAAALASGRNVVAAELKEEWLGNLKARHEGEGFATVVGDIGSEAGAAALWEAASTAFDGIDHVVVSVNVPVSLRPLMQFDGAELARVLAGNVVTHFNAAKTFLPRMPAHGVLIGIGGGTADFIFPQMAHISMGQAAIRMMYKGVAKEVKSGAQAHELMIVSMVASDANRDVAQPDWVTDVEVGRHVCAIFDAPENFPKPVLHLRSKAQVGSPEPEA